MPLISEFPIAGPQGKQGPVGPEGKQGPEGKRGPMGPAGPGTGDMLAMVYDPQGKAIDVYKYTDDAVAGRADLTLSNLSNRQKALRNIGGRPRWNLLGNAYFKGGGSQQGGGQFPINQRGQTSYTGIGYGIDRWKWDRSDELASMIIHDGYTTFQRNGWLRQIVESGRTTFDGKTMTASILTNEGELQTVTFVATANDSYANTERWMFNHYFNGHAWIFGFCAFNRDCNALAAKLELGSRQTLAYQDESGNWQLFETPDYAEELAKCQRYYCKSAINLNESPGGEIAFAQSAEWLNTAVKFPVEMRITPTVSIRRIAFCSNIGQNLLIEGASAEVGGIDQTGFNTVKVSGISIQTDARYNIQYEASAEL